MDRGVARDRLDADRAQLDALSARIKLRANKSRESLRQTQRRTTANQSSDNEPLDDDPVQPRQQTASVYPILDGPVLPSPPRIQASQNDPRHGQRLANQPQASLYPTLDDPVQPSPPRVQASQNNPRHGQRLANQSQAYGIEPAAASMQYYDTPLVRPAPANPEAQNTNPRPSEAPQVASRWGPRTISTTALLVALLAVMLSLELGTTFGPVTSLSALAWKTIKMDTSPGHDGSYYERVHASADPLADSTQALKHVIDRIDKIAPVIIDSTTDLGIDRLLNPVKSLQSDFVHVQQRLRNVNSSIARLPNVVLEASHTTSCPLQRKVETHTLKAIDIVSRFALTLYEANLTAHSVLQTVTFEIDTARADQAREDEQYKNPKQSPLYTAGKDYHQTEDDVFAQIRRREIFADELSLVQKAVADGAEIASSEFRRFKQLETNLKVLSHRANRLVDITSGDPRRSCSREEASSFLNDLFDKLWEGIAHESD